MSSTMDLTIDTTLLPNLQFVRCMARSTSRKTSMLLRPLNSLTFLNMTSWAVSSPEPKLNWSKSDSPSQFCSLIWLLWSNWEMSSRSISTSLASKTRRIETCWLTIAPQRQLRPPSNWSPVSLFMLVISVPLWDHMRSVLNGLTCCLMSSSTKETWRKPNSLMCPWCAIVPPLTLPEVKLVSFSLSSCQSSSNLLTFAQRSITCNSRAEDKTLKSGKLEPNLKRSRRKRKTRWRKSSPKLFLRERLLTLLASSPISSTPSQSKECEQQRSLTNYEKRYSLIYNQFHYYLMFRSTI